MPEDGDPAGPDGRVGPRRAGVVDRVRAARQDDRARAAALELLVRRVVRQQLRVDVELADAPRDQLGELAAEVEDDDRRAVGRSAAPAGPVVGRAVRGRGLERGLEVGLDLGVVGGEDAVAGVGRLAVDGLAALAGLVGRRPASARPRRSVRRLVGRLGRRPPIRPPLAVCRRQCTRRRPARAGSARQPRLRIASAAIAK